MSAYGSLFIGDLPKFCEEHHIEELFSPFGPIIDVKIKRSTNMGRTVTYGFVTIASFEAAEIARQQLNGAIFMGRSLK